nr:hypothetical protein [Tanacetum cinerariifolium]
MFEKIDTLYPQMRICRIGCYGARLCLGDSASPFETTSKSYSSCSSSNGCNDLGARNNKKQKVGLPYDTVRNEKVKKQGPKMQEAFHPSSTSAWIISFMDPSQSWAARFDSAQLDCAVKRVANGHGEYRRAPNVNPKDLLNFAGILLLASMDDYSYHFVTWAGLNISVSNFVVIYGFAVS